MPVAVGRPYRMLATVVRGVCGGGAAVVYGVASQCGHAPRSPSQGRGSGVCRELRISYRGRIRQGFLSRRSRDHARAWQRVRYGCSRQVLATGALGRCSGRGYCLKLALTFEQRTMVPPCGAPPPRLGAGPPTHIGNIYNVFGERVPPQKSPKRHLLAGRKCCSAWPGCWAHARNRSSRHRRPSLSPRRPPRCRHANR